MSDDQRDLRLTGADLHERFERFLADGQAGAGVAAFEQICAQNPRWGLAHDLLGQLREAAAQMEAAYEAYRAGMNIGLRSRRMSRQLKADLVLKVIEFCLSRDWHERAMSHLDALEELAPHHPLVAQLRGADKREAEAHVADHMSRRQRAQAWVHEARSRFEARDYLAARDLYLKALATDERSTNAYIFLTRTFEHLGGQALNEGVAYFEDLVRRRPNWGLGFNLLGQLHAAAGSDEEAYQALVRGADLSDTSPTLDARRKAELRADLVRFCEARTWPERSQAQRERLRALAPAHPLAASATLLPGIDDSDDPERVLQAARAASQIGQWVQAARYYQGAIQRHPRLRVAYSELAAVYLQMGATGRAQGLRFFGRLVEMSPKWGLVWRLLGQLHAASGDDDAAYRALREATLLGVASTRLPSAVKIDHLMELVTFCSERQWFNRALEHVKLVLELQPDNGPARSLLAVLTARGAPERLEEDSQAEF
ncbi:MAG: hypothetical protein KC620_05150 [Myxococcales bacterium]|nr:hypothetical protein [Myxococcales bacterium]